MNKVIFLSLSVYLGLSPVYWYPGISPSILAGFKLFLIGMGITFIFFKAISEGSLFFPMNILGPFGLILILFASFGGLVQSDLGVIILKLKDYFLSFIMLWAFYSYQKSGGNSSRIFLTAGIILAAHCFLVTLSKVAGFPSWSGPTYYVAPNLWVSGFGSLRTGWSNGIALFVPVLIAYALCHTGTSRLLKAVSLLSAAMIVSSQIVVAGKAGLLASLISTLLILLLRGNRKFLIVYVLVGIVIAVGVSDYMYDAMRLDQVQAQRTEFGKWDRFSAGRIGSNLKAIELGLERPIMGYGLDKIAFRGYEIHNLWIKMFIESGFMLPLVFLLFTFTAYRNIRYCYQLFWKKQLVSKFNSGSKVLVDFGIPLLLAGVVVSMFEPRFLLGAFQPSALWWAVIGAGVGLKDFLALHEGSSQC